MRTADTHHLRGYLSRKGPGAGVFVLQAALAVTIVGLGGATLVGGNAIAQAFAHVGAGSGVRFLIGAIEIAAGLCLLLPRTAMIGVAALIALSIGISGVIMRDATRTIHDSTEVAATAPRLERAFEGGVQSAPQIVRPATSHDI
jgi:hypothetical protein